MVLQQLADKPKGKTKCNLKTTLSSFHKIALFIAKMTTPAAERLQTNAAQAHHERARSRAPSYLILLMAVLFLA